MTDRAAEAEYNAAVARNAVLQDRINRLQERMDVYEALVNRYLAAASDRERNELMPEMTAVRADIDRINSEAMGTGLR